MRFGQSYTEFRLQVAASLTSSGICTGASWFMSRDTMPSLAFGLGTLIAFAFVTSGIVCLVLRNRIGSLAKILTLILGPLCAVLVWQASHTHLVLEKGPITVNDHLKVYPEPATDFYEELARISLQDCTVTPENVSKLLDSFVDLNRIQAVVRVEYYRYDPVTKRLVPVSPLSVGWNSPIDSRSFQIMANADEAPEGLAAGVFLTGESIVVHDSRHIKPCDMFGFKEFNDASQHNDQRSLSLIGVPVPASEELRELNIPFSGVLFLSSPRANVFKKAQIPLLRAFAASIACDMCRRVDQRLQHQIK